jgi:hypothetical protein
LNNLILIEYMAIVFAIKVFDSAPSIKDELECLLSTLKDNLGYSHTITIANTTITTISTTIITTASILKAKMSRNIILNLENLIWF